jgi:hypothetical protein
MTNATCSGRAIGVIPYYLSSAIRSTSLLFSLVLMIPFMVSAQPTTNGRFLGDGDNALYNLAGIAEANSGYLFTYAGPDSIYALMRVDPSFNDNVFGDSGNNGVDTAYVDSVNWNTTRSWKTLYNSDFNEWHMECGDNVFQWKQDYLADLDHDRLPRQATDGEADFTSDNTTDQGDGTQPPGLLSASSLQWNMNHSTWDVTMGGTRTSWDTYKSPVGFPTNGYPFYDPATGWEWSMNYEIAFPRSVCGPEDISIWVVSAHNSPIKEGDPDIPVCDPEITACDVLPVELVDFAAVEDHGDVVLHWTTASETNNAGFAVEHTVNGGVFAEIGFVDGAGSTDIPQSYTFRVDNVEPGRHSFKLKQIDFDGSFVYSAAVEVDVEVPGQFVLENAYPNPFNPQATLRFAVAERGPVTLTLYDVAGRAIRTLYNGTPEPDQMHEIDIDGRSLPSGIYVVRMVGSSFIANRTLTLAK